MAQARTPHQTAFQSLVSRLDNEIAARTPGPLVFEMSFPIRTQVTPPSKRPGKVRKSVDVVLAPSLNEYAGMAPWMLLLARAELDRLIRERCGYHPQCDCGSMRNVVVKHVKRTVRATKSAKPTSPSERVSKVEKIEVSGGRRRIIEVVRHSSQEVDELAVDILGGKLVVDRLIWAGVIAGDDRTKLVRMPRWVRCAPGNGKLEVRVYETNRVE